MNKTTLLSTTAAALMTISVAAYASTSDKTANLEGAAVGTYLGKTEADVRSALEAKGFQVWSVLAVQSACALFFAMDAFADVTGSENWFRSYNEDLVEVAVICGLAIGIIFVCLEIRSLLKRNQKAEAQLKAASGVFFELLNENFDLWSPLTPSERDVALLAIKGLSLAEIAEIRETKQGPM